MTEISHIPIEHDHSLCYGVTFHLKESFFREWRKILQVFLDLFVESVEFGISFMKFKEAISLSWEVCDANNLIEGILVAFRDCFSNAGF